MVFSPSVHSESKVILRPIQIVLPKDLFSLEVRSAIILTSKTNFKS